MDVFVHTYRGAVYPWHCDQMGHMNVMHYVGKFDQATWQLMAAIGITSSYMRAQECGVAALRQNISYRRELRAGDLVSIRSAVLEIGPKLIRFYHEMHNDETGVLSATMLITAVHMDLKLRKACAFPDEVVACATGMLADLTPII